MVTRAAIIACLLFAASPCFAQQKTPPAKDAGKSDAAPQEQVRAPYEAKLLRLAEILGALTYMQDLCGPKDGATIRSKMSGLIEAEAKTPAVRERFAGAYNRGFRGYELSYHACTPNAQLVISRFLAEAGRIARDVTSRYGAS